MKNFQDDFYDKNNCLENENNHLGKETDHDHTAHDQNIQEGVSKDRKSVEEIREGNEEKEKSFEQEARADSTKSQDGSEEIRADAEGASVCDEPQIKESLEQEKKSSDYSCSYKPPYYVPDFTVVDSSNREDQKRKTGTKAWTIVLSVLIVSLALMSVAFIGLQLGRNGTESNASDSSGQEGQNQSVTVSKNDSPIQVNVEIDSSDATALSIEQVVERVADTVVEIVTTRVQTGQFGYGQYVNSGAGSGVLIDKEGRGYIITNYHVIGDNPDQTSITVRLTSGAEYEADYVAGDETSDVAILKIDGTNLPYALMGSSDSLKVGQGVVAIGNPLGELGGTVTNGIISALDRQVIVDGNRMTLLQTNAEINPGNSGGGLFDMAGRLIGIVNAKQSATGIEGLGFAIPIDVAWDVASDLIQYGYVVDRLILPFEAEYRDDLTYQFGSRSMPASVYIMNSQHSELYQYDRIVSINGKTIATISDYYMAVDQIQEGDTISLMISRLGQNYQFREYSVAMTAQFTKAPNT